MPELSTGQLVNAGQRCYAILEHGTRGDQGKLSYWDVLSEMLTGSTRTPPATGERSFRRDKDILSDGRGRRRRNSWACKIASLGSTQGTRRRFFPLHDIINNTFC